MIDLGMVSANLLSPVVLFFFLGMIATIVKSDLQIPQPIPKFLSLYLLMAIGIKGGVGLREAGFDQEVVSVLLAAMVMAVAVPFYTFFILKRKLDVYNAGAIAATYGSISAVTFITACSLLQTLNISYSGFMVAAMALMESPAIIIGVLLVRYFSKNPNSNDFSWAKLLHEAFCNGSVLLIMGSFAIGLLCGERCDDTLKPFVSDIFKGMLSLFLLDMGIVAARRIQDLNQNKGFILGFSISIPLLNAAIALVLAHWLGLSVGNSFLFVVLCASASYIAVPAAMRLSIPEANPSIYVPMSLAITFPFNIVIGIPFYYYFVNLVRGAS